MKCVISKSVAVTLLTMGLVASSFGVGVNWNNDGVTTGNGAPFYLDAAGQISVPAGDLVQLAAIKSGTNFVLASAAIGDTGGKGDGWFQITSVIPSNLLANAQGCVLEVLFYNTTDASGSHGTVYNNAITCPAPSGPNKNFGIERHGPSVRARCQHGLYHGRQRGIGPGLLHCRS